MAEHPRLSVEAAEALADVLLADAMIERRKWLGTVAMIRRWLTPWWGYPGSIAFTSMGPHWNLLDGQHRAMWDQAYALGTVSTHSAATFADETPHSRCSMQDFGPGCLWNDWHHWQDTAHWSRSDDHHPISST